jgi:hypothetical protein
VNVPTPSIHDRQDDYAEKQLRRRIGIIEDSNEYWIDPEQMKMKDWKGETGVGGNSYRQMCVSIASILNVVPSSTTKEAEKQRERDLAKKADDIGEFYIPMGKAPHFVTDEELDELGGKPEVIEPFFKIQLTALRHRSKEEMKEEEGEEEEEEETGLNTLLLDEFHLDPYEHGTCINAVRLFDESQESMDAFAEGNRVTTAPRTTIRGRNFIAVGTTNMPFRGEEERSSGRVLLFRVDRGKLELVCILKSPDPVMGLSTLTMSKKEIKRCKDARYGNDHQNDQLACNYDVGGFLLVARGRTLETFKFRRAPGGSGRLVGYSLSTKKAIVMPTDGKTGNRDRAAMAALDPQKEIPAEIPYDSAQLRMQGPFINSQLFVHSISVLNEQYVLVADVYRSVQFIRWVRK